MTTSARLCVACLPTLALLLVTACSPERGPATGQATAPGALAPTPSIAESNERTWVGLLPCSDCQGIDTRLVLRADGGRRGYVMVETYVGGSGENSFKRVGSWSEQAGLVAGESLTVYTLDPAQAGQRFALQPDGALEMLDGAGRAPAEAVAYRLQRQ